MIRKSFLLAAALAAAGCGSQAKNTDQAIREKELMLKTQELALQKRSLELQEQELKQARENQEQMQALLQQKNAAPAAAAPAMASAAYPASQMAVRVATSAPYTPPDIQSPEGAAGVVDPQVQLQQLQNILKQLQDEGAAAGRPAANPYIQGDPVQPAAAPPTNTNATTQNAQSSEMQKMFDDLRRRSGAR